MGLAACWIKKLLRYEGSVLRQLINIFVVGVANENLLYMYLDNAFVNNKSFSNSI